jgi:molybdate transport system substrate-binding protein
MKFNSLVHFIIRLFGRVLLFPLFLFSVGIHAQELKVIASTGVYSVLQEMIPGFEKQANIKLLVTYDTSNIILQRVQSGEVADLIILTSAAIDDLIRQGKVAEAGRTNLASSGIGFAIRSGSKRPDISTPEELKKALLEAQSIAYTGTGASGIYFLKVANQLGVGEQVKAKGISPPGGHIAKLVAAGDAQLGVQMKSELMGVPGSEYIGPLPPQLQMNTVFTAGIFSNSRQAAKSLELVRYLSSPSQAAIYIKLGMDPAI